MPAQADATVGTEKTLERFSPLAAAFPVDVGHLFTNLVLQLSRNTSTISG